MKRMMAVVAVCLAFAASGVSAAEPMTPEQIVKSRVAEAKANVPAIDHTTLRQWIDEGEKEFILLDVREPKEVTAGKIEADDYLSVPRGLVEFQVTKKVKDLDKPVVVYCLKGGRGVLVADTLMKLGYTNVYNLEGGILGWVNAGHPVSNFFGEFEVDNFDSNFEKKS